MKYKELTNGVKRILAKSVWQHEVQLFNICNADNSERKKNYQMSINMTLKTLELIILANEDCKDYTVLNNIALWLLITF